MIRFIVLLGWVVAGPAFSASLTGAAVAGFSAFKSDLLLISGSLLAVSLLVFPVRFIARLFRG